MPLGAQNLLPAPHILQAVGILVEGHLYAEKNPEIVRKALLKKDLSFCANIFARKIDPNITNPDLGFVFSRFKISEEEHYLPLYYDFAAGISTRIIQFCQIRQNLGNDKDSE